MLIIYLSFVWIEHHEQLEMTENNQQSSNNTDYQPTLQQQENQW